MFTGRAEADSGLLSEPVCRLWATGISYCVLILCVHLWIYSLTGLRWFALCCSLVVRALRTGGPCRRTGQGRPSPGAARLRLVAALRFQRCPPCSGTGCVIVTSGGHRVRFPVPPSPRGRHRQRSPRLVPGLRGKSLACTPGGRSGRRGRAVGSVEPGFSPAPPLGLVSGEFRLCCKRALVPDICYQSYSPQIFMRQ